MSFPESICFCEQWFVHAYSCCTKLLADSMFRPLFSRRAEERRRKRREEEISDAKDREKEKEDLEAKRRKQHEDESIGNRFSFLIFLCCLLLYY